MERTLVSFFYISVMLVSVLNSESIVHGGIPTTSTLHYNLNNCDAFVLAGTVRDYSEFIGLANNSSCTELTPLSTIYRDNANVNTHSCTEGVNESPGMCVSSLEGCSYSPGHEKSIKFDIMVVPGISGSGNISNLSFYEQAPVNYNWLSGPAGLNDYPTKYGVRVLKNGNEIFVSAELSTTNDWTLEYFDFSGNSQFTVAEPTIFSFELLAYCIIGNNAGVTAWDIDEISVISTCESDAISGGELSLLNGDTTLSICANDGISDAFDVIINAATGNESLWLITDQLGVIIGLPSSPPFELEGTGNGLCLLWNISYEGPLSGNSLGSNINGLQGCYGLSNPIMISRNMQAGASISTVDGETDLVICAGDGLSDAFDVLITDNNAPMHVWVITDAGGIILEVPSGPPFDLEAAGLGVCFIRTIGFDSEISGLDIGSNISDISGCFGFSNAIKVTRTFATEASINSGGETELLICAGDGIADLIDVAVEGGTGSFTSWIITNLEGNINSLPSGPPFNLDGTVQGTCLIWHLSHDGFVDGLNVDDNIFDLSGCFGLSNSITVTKVRTAGGVLSMNNFTFFKFCSGDSLLSSLNPTLNGNSGIHLSWILTDEDGIVLEFLPPPPFDLSNTPAARYRIYAISHDSVEPGILLGENVSILSESCAGISNPLIIAKELAIGGTISTETGDVLELCVQGPGSMPINIELTGAVGAFSRWLVTDHSGNIIGLPGSPPFAINVIGRDSCLVYHLSYEPSYSGLSLGNNIDNFKGCYELSNAITLIKEEVDGGILKTIDNSTQINFCGEPDDAQVLEILLNENKGVHEAWVITTVAGVIVELPSGPPFDFASFPDDNYRIWHISYNSELNGLEVGLNIDDLSGNCFDRSNYIGVSKDIVEGGEISSSLGDFFTICSGDGIPDIMDVELINNYGRNSRWVLTDDLGNITKLPGLPPYNMDTANGSTCLIRHLSFGNITGLQVGNNISNIVGCYDFSNAITVNKMNVNGGTVVSSFGDVITACLDGVADNIDVSVLDASGKNNQLVIVDVDGKILDLPIISKLNFEGGEEGTCFILNISFEHVDGLGIGKNLDNLEGCFDLSNSLKVNKVMKDAGEISIDGELEITICAGDGTPNPIDIELFGGDTGVNTGWLITDISGKMLEISASPPFDLENAGVGVCLIRRISYDNSTQGIIVGRNINDISGCFDLSNELVVTRVTFEEASTAISSVLFDLNECLSDAFDGSDTDYSELVGVATNDAECTTLEIIDSYLYRENPDVNVHSCTPGVNGSIAMCVNSHPTCAFLDDNDRSIRFSINVSPSPSGQGALSSLNFYERAPVSYEWVNGNTGINNYPTRYGVRIMRNGVEVFKQVDIATSNDWTLESFDFSTNPNFMVFETTQFDFELLAYCRIGNSAPVNAWDIDEITIGSSCSNGLSSGVITSLDGSTELEICIDQDAIEPIEVMVFGAAGDNSQWVITDADNNILELPLGPLFDFENAGVGIYNIYFLSYVDGLKGAAIGLNISELQGCFALSNAISVDIKSLIECTGNTVEEEELEELFGQSDFVQDFDVMPNPVIDILTIKTDYVPAKGTMLFIYDRMGRILLTKELITSSTEINLEAMANGFYYAKVISGNYQSVQAFVKL